MRKVKLTESQFITIIKKVVSEGQKEIDDILDKINKVGGVAGLSKKEKEYLDYHATTGKFLDKKSLSTSHQIAQYGETWYFQHPGMPTYQFKYEVTEETPDEIIHTGYFNVNGDEYYGEIYCDTEGEYSVCNFNDAEGENVFERYEELEKEIELFLQVVCNDLKDEMKGGMSV